jgi:hypothetical protein
VEVLSQLDLLEEFNMLPRPGWCALNALQSSPHMPPRNGQQQPRLAQMGTAQTPFMGLRC